MKSFSKTQKFRRKLVFYSVAAEIGGAEKYLQLLISKLSREDFEIVLVASAALEVNAWLVSPEWAKVTISRVAPQRFFNWRYVLKLIKIFYQAEVLHFNFGSVAGDKNALVAGWFCRKARQVATVHLVGSYQKQSKFWNRFATGLIRFWYRRIEKIIVVSEINKQQLCEKFKIPACKVHRIYNGIDWKKYIMQPSPEILRQQLGVPSGKILFGTVGRFHLQKGHQILIQAAQRVIRINPDCYFVLIGEGELKAALQEQIQELKLSNYFYFTGFREDIPQILSALDVLVQPSLLEGFPFSILEAMAAGLPVIASDVGGVCELVEQNLTGFLVSAGEAEELAQSMLKLSCDSSQRKKLGKRGQEKVSLNFNLDKMYSETLALYY